MNSEIFHILGERHLEAPDYFPDRAILEGLPPHMLDEFIDDCATKSLEIDGLMRMAIEIKESRDE